MRWPALQIVVAIGLCVFCPLVAPAADGPLVVEWTKYRDRFIGDDGRVHDTGNKEISHTEGQGLAMLFAVSFDDRATFDRVWGWTRDNLRRRDSALFAWRWDPNEKNPVADTNNATDGDVLIAWALLRAGVRWHETRYREEAGPMLAEIRSTLVERIGGRLVLMPGGNGFRAKDGAAIVNPSYYVYPALREFSAFDPSPVWDRLRRDGLSLLARARFGRWGLPTDWVTVGNDGGVTPAANLPPRFGFDAIRIPLYLIWGREATASRLAPDLRFWSGFTAKPVPAWVNVDDGSVAPFPAPDGFQAVIQLTRSWPSPNPLALPEIADNDDYYSASLILLAALASEATRR